MFRHKSAYMMFSLLTSSAIAGTMGPVCEPGQVNVPCSRVGWGAGVEGLYLKAAFNRDMTIIGVRTTNTSIDTSPISSVNIRNDEVIPGLFDWGWGYKIHGAYYFGAGKDINVNWLHYRNTTIQNEIIQPGSLNTIENFPTQYTTTPSLDAVNIEAAQQVTMQEFTQVRYYAGVQFARIKADLSTQTADFETNHTPPEFVLNSFGSTSLRFNGFGPRMGADINYYLLPQLSVYGKAATSLLVGKYQFSSHDSFTIFDDPNETFSTTISHAQGSASSRIVPELEAQLGLTYLRSFALGDVSLNLGYMWINYFSPLQNSLNGSSDLGLSGINFGAKWVG